MFISRMHVSRIHHSRLGSRQFTESPRAGIRDTPFGWGIEADKNQFNALFLTFIWKSVPNSGNRRSRKHIGWETCIREKDIDTIVNAI